MKPMRRLLSMAGLCALLLAVGCSTTSNTEPPELEPASDAGSEVPAEFSLSDSGPDLDPIFFDTDKALLRADARATLKRHAEAIRQHPEWGVLTIEGHCDERGSEEYNLALGKRRATAVARYLSDLGVDRSRLETRSYGEARPAFPGHSEAAWRQNRRAQMVSELLHAAQR